MFFIVFFWFVSFWFNEHALLRIDGLQFINALIKISYLNWCPVNCSEICLGTCHMYANLLSIDFGRRSFWKHASSFQTQGILQTHPRFVLYSLSMELKKGCTISNETFTFYENFMKYSLRYSPILDKRNKMNGVLDHDSAF